MAEFSEVTVHGRFQPPLHVNHWNYVRRGFELGDHVTLLITNPFNDESFDAAASWRTDPENNPFTFDERVFMFDAFFAAMDIARERYTIKPFNIKDPKSFEKLDPATMNLVNVYSDWSAKKIGLFKGHGLPVENVDIDEKSLVSGTKIRKIINEHSGSEVELKARLIEADFMPEAIPGLLKILRRRA